MCHPAADVTVPSFSFFQLEDLLQQHHPQLLLVEGDQTGHHPQESQLAAVAAKYGAELQLTAAPDSRQLLQQLQARSNQPGFDQLQAAATAAREAVEKQLQGDQQGIAEAVDTWKLQQQQQQLQEQEQQQGEEQQEFGRPAMRGADDRERAQNALGGRSPLISDSGAPSSSSSSRDGGVEAGASSSRSGSPFPDALTGRMNEGGAPSAAAAAVGAATAAAGAAVGWVQGILSGSSSSSSTASDTGTTSSSSSSGGGPSSSSSSRGGGGGKSSSSSSSSGSRSVGASSNDAGAGPSRAGGGFTAGVKGMVGLLAAGMGLDLHASDVKEMSFDLPDESLRSRWVGAAGGEGKSCITRLDVCPGHANARSLPDCLRGPCSPPYPQGMCLIDLWRVGGVYKGLQGS